MNYLNTMVDIETMSTEYNSAIVSLAAVEFDKSGILREFYETIDLSSSAVGFDMDPQTVIWWLRQSDLARAEIYDADKGLMEVLYDFSEWLNPNSAIWSNGAEFDMIILGNAYNTMEIEQPWYYQNIRCYRTIVNMNKRIGIKRLGVSHNALDDAIYQTNYLLALGVLND